MGCYINPPSQTKENWLMLNATPLSSPPISLDPDGIHLIVCLVNNGGFTAAAVVFDERELRLFLREGDRERVWFIVKKEKLYEVSNLRMWETKHDT